jgi:hypothetical protein
MATNQGRWEKLADDVVLRTFNLDVGLVIETDKLLRFSHRRSRAEARRRMRSLVLSRALESSGGYE